jgi:hypothetical protein
MALLLLQGAHENNYSTNETCFGPECRKELLKYVSETTNVSDGAERFGEWLSDHGYSATSTAVLDVRLRVYHQSLVFLVMNG